MLVRPHPLYLALGLDGNTPGETYRALFQSALANAALAEQRMALNQNQPIGNDRFYTQIEVMTGQKREMRKRRRPRKELQEESAANDAQHDLPL